MARRERERLEYEENGGKLKLPQEGGPFAQQQVTYADVC
jgi:hypothetical protein